MSPQEILWREAADQYDNWLWIGRHLCRTCRTSAREFWFGRRDEQSHRRQLVMFSDAEAPLDLDADWTFRRKRPGYRKWLASPWNTGAS